MLISVLLFCVGLVLLIKGGDWFVDGSTAIAKRFHLPEILIGATIVSIGTTLPEVMVSATAAIEGSGQIAYGNAVGSIICNTSLIAALTIAIRPCDVDKNSMRVPVIFFFCSAIFYAAIAYFVGEFTRLIGLILLAIFVIYIVYSSLDAKKHIKLGKELSNEAQEEAEESEKKQSSVVKELLLLIIGAAAIAVGAKLLVTHGTVIAEGLGVPESVIGLTFVALGTSLPELVTAITSLVKGHGALSLGNIIGANLFNLVLVSGTSVTLSPFKVPVENKFMGYNTSLLIEIPLMLFVMAFLTLPALWRGKLSRFQGIALLVIYAAFCVFQFAV